MKRGTLTRVQIQGNASKRPNTQRTVNGTSPVTRPHTPRKVTGCVPEQQESSSVQRDFVLCLSSHLEL